RNSRLTSCLPGNDLRASTYAAGMPITSETTTVIAATPSVTPITCARPKRSQDSEYHWAVQPSGSQVLNHCLPNESTITEMITPTSMMKKITTPPQTSQADGDATSDFSPGARFSARC